MTRWTPCLLAMAVAALAGSAAAAPPAAEDKDGWTPLFNGKDLTGWKLPEKLGGNFTSYEAKKNADGKVTAFVAKYADKKKGETEYTIWRVEDGAIVGG